MMLSLQDTIKKIENGRCLSIAADESLLSQLPKGNWIGGTIPYFMTKDGGKITTEQLSVTDFTDVSIGTSIKSYELEDLPKLNEDAEEHGFSMVIIPAMSPAHLAYGHDAPNYHGFFMKPIVGWICGTLLDDHGKIPPKVFNGTTGRNSDKKAIVMHCKIDPSKYATVSILNLFKQGDGDEIMFEEEGFSAKTCLVNGKQVQLIDYLKEKNIDLKPPLVADYCGAMVNVGIQGPDEAEGVVRFFAPVYRDVKYKFGAPVGNYVEEFKKALPKDVSPIWSCNCLLNFLYSELEGKVVEKMYGPITYGEIAYQLVNQTLVYLEVK
ncbi:MAG: hypothetical protein FWG02_11700 [Holophagaceae bacterium]|nr:hypothetical protein [Holophagaceae bacterium]